MEKKKKKPFFLHERGKWDFYLRYSTLFSIIDFSRKNNYFKSYIENSKCMLYMYKPKERKKKKKKLLGYIKL